MMRGVYTLAMHLYAWLVGFASLFNRKARLTHQGQRRTYQMLREQIDPNRLYLWFHAASLGEFEQGRPLIEAIRAQCPKYSILLTFFSPSGYEVRKHYEGADVICYLPFDTPGQVNTFLNLANPAQAIFIKYEFWLNYLCELKKRRIPTYIVSATFRPDQLFFKPYGSWYRQALHCFDQLFVQDQPSLQLLAQQGITNVSVCGDTRFDRVLDIQKQAKQVPLIDRFVSNRQALVLVAGSTWPEDEKALLPYVNAHPNTLLLIAPHEIDGQHLANIELALTRPSIRLSEATEQNIVGKDCLIIDSFGLLSSIYRYGHLAYIGGGFGKGIHNTLEAAVYGIPLLFGPNYHKFREAKGLIDAGGAFALPNQAAVADRLDALLSNPEWREKAGQAVADFVSQNAGATQKILDQLRIGF